MDEKKLFVIAALCSAIGLIAIIMLPFIFEPKEIKISEISEKDIGKKISIAGTIKYLVKKDNLTLLELNDGTGKIKVVFFKRITFKESEGKVTGSIDKYNEELEIKAENIEEI